MTELKNKGIPLFPMAENCTNSSDLPNYISSRLVYNCSYLSGIFVSKSWRFQKAVCYNVHMDILLCRCVFYLYG